MPKPEAPAARLEISVLMGAEAGDTDLAREAQLVKTALLYADHVELVSPKAALVQAALDLLDAPERVRQDRILELATPLMDPETAEALRSLTGRRGKQRSPELIVLEEQLRASMRPKLAEFETVVLGIAAQPGITEVQRALAEGVLTLNTLGMRPVPTMKEAIRLAARKVEKGQGQLDVVERMLAEIADSVAPSATSHPMFDEQAGGLLRSMIDEGVLPGVDLGPATHAHLAGHLVGTLDAFPEAHVDEVLDVRRALAEPLVRFRAAVTSMSRELDARPIDPGFHRAADALYRERVAPELLALDESFRESRIREQLWRQASRGEGAGGVKRAVAMGFVAYTVLPELTVAATAAGAGIAETVYDLAAAISKRRQELAAQRRTNHFLFLYEAGRRLQH